MKDTQAEVVMKQINYIRSMSNTFSFEMIANILYFRDFVSLPNEIITRFSNNINIFSSAIIVATLKKSGT